MNAPHSPRASSIPESMIVATPSTRAEQKDGDDPNRFENSPKETPEETAERYAAVPDLEWPKYRADEIHKLHPHPPTKAALDEVRKQGKRQQREREKAKAQQEREQSGAEQKRRLSPDELAEVTREVEAIIDLEGLTLAHRISDIAERWGQSPADIRSELRSIQKRRAEETGSKTGGLEVAFDDPEPWDYPVDGRSLLTEIRNVIADNMDLPPHVAELCALWIAHTYCYRLFDHSIRLAIMSPQPRCGKTRLQDLIARMAWRAMQAANITPAAMFRLVAHYGVTLIIDEVDTFLTGPNASEESRGILNAGHGRSGQVLRCEGDDNKVVGFPCYGPVVLGGIGSLPATIADRSALAFLERKRPDKKLDRIDLGADRWQRIRRQLRRWIDDSYEDLARANPDIPAELTDRQADGWRALLSIARVAGGDWPAKANAAALGLSGAEPDSETVEVQLLADIFELFHENKAGDSEPARWAVREVNGKPKAMPSKDIAEALNRLDDRPWPEWKKGKGLSSSSLTRLLGKFRIHSKQLKGQPGIGPNVNPKGYRYEQFSEAWAKYLDSKRYSATTRRNPPKTEKNETLPKEGGSDSDLAGNPQESATCSGVAFLNGGFGPVDDGLPEQRPCDDGEMEVAL
jgi:hypothetical protein